MLRAVANTTIVSSRLLRAVMAELSSRGSSPGAPEDLFPLRVEGQKLVKSIETQIPLVDAVPVSIETESLKYNDMRLIPGPWNSIQLKKSAQQISNFWLKFPKSCGRKQATKLRNLSARLNLDDDAVPITSQTSSVALNNNKTIIAKRKHFPLVSALAMTIHKSQGGIYDAIVYEYDRKHPRELVYVALSRVTKIEGLFMVTKENTEDSWKFWIGRSGIPLNASESDKHLKRSTSHREDLTLELKRLKNNTLQTVTQTFLEFISNKKGLSIFSFNCQSLHAHVTDLKNDAIVKKSNVLLLSETRMKNEEPIHIPDFNFVASYKRPEVPAAGVAIYQHTQDTSHIVTSYMDIHTKFTRGIGVNVST
ncbi:uncharacterized protein TNCV_2680141 [Trichonephila clavipes]|uniref:ATP-dependent DNA helicase n=1 Tax=Trichonephila clavipes TaxID=2585209 RepID=A0A8X6S7Q5_TRICX|nr:uncharacterized protein TNCV_2680141 [Trichonephila clavipes]